MGITIKYKGNSNAYTKPESKEKIQDETKSKRREEEEKKIRRTHTKLQKFGGIGSLKQKQKIQIEWIGEFPYFSKMNKHDYEGFV